MRALSTETSLSTGCAEKNKTNCCSYETLLQQVLTCKFGVNSCHCLAPRNFLSDYQLLQSGFSRCSVSSGQLHGLRMFFLPTEVGHVCASITNSEMCTTRLSRDVFQSGSGTGGACQQLLMQRVTKIIEHKQIAWMIRRLQVHCWMCDACHREREEKTKTCTAPSKNWIFDVICVLGFLSTQTQCIRSISWRDASSWGKFKDCAVLPLMCFWNLFRCLLVFQRR